MLAVLTTPHPTNEQIIKLHSIHFFHFHYPTTLDLLNSMAPSPSTLRLLSLVEDIKIAIEKDDASNTATRPDLLANISKLRDAVEAPQDSLLRIYSQVSHTILFQSLDPTNLMDVTSAIAECSTEGRC